MLGSSITSPWPALQECRTEYASGSWLPSSHACGCVRISGALTRHHRCTISYTFRPKGLRVVRDSISKGLRVSSSHAYIIIGCISDSRRVLQTTPSPRYCKTNLIFLSTYILSIVSLTFLDVVSSKSQCFTGAALSNKHILFDPMQRL